MAKRREIYRHLDFATDSDLAMSQVPEDRVGKAYSLFLDPTQGLEGELDYIQRLVKVPGNVELYLTDIRKYVAEDSKMMDLVDIAKSRVNKILEVKFNGASNSEASGVAVDVIDQAYQSNLYEQGEDFTGSIMFKKEDGEYALRQ